MLKSATQQMLLAALQPETSIINRRLLPVFTRIAIATGGDTEEHQQVYMSKQLYPFLCPEKQALLLNRAASGVVRKC